jgi:DNA-directed DNA polymerase III PolC
MFTHLHTHSYYSLLTGIPSPAQLAETAAKHEMVALALTDHNRLTGAIEFYDACSAEGVQPILGLEITVQVPLRQLTPSRPINSNIILLAMDMVGWGNLCRLSSAVLDRRNHDYDEILELNQVTRDTRGLICLTGGRKGCFSTLIKQGNLKLAAQVLSQLKEGFPERVYVELQNSQTEVDEILSSLSELATRLNLPTVATDDIYTLSSEQAQLQKTLSAIRLNRPIIQLSEHEYALPDADFSSPDELISRFSDFPGALAGTKEIADRCRLELPLGQHHFPKINLPPGSTPIQVLRKKALSGAEARYGKMTSEIESRLDHELSAIDESGYSSLFLIMEEIINFAIQADIPMSSRGSAASSLVAHCLGITNPDPIKLNLYFERFLNPARRSPPDIDTDLCSKRRDEVINFVYERFGLERVAMVSTIIRFRPRSALREVAKAHGLTQKEIKRLIDNLPRRGWGPPRRVIKSEESPFESLKVMFAGPRYRHIFVDAAQILNFPRHLSVHPGGVVISPGTMTELVPTQMTNKGIRVTQFDLEPVGKMGLVKIDLLGTRGLSVLGDVADEQRKSMTTPTDRRLDFLEAIPYHDPTTEDLIRDGRTIGCFAIESPGMRRVLKEIKAHSLDDIMIALALYRPGPMTGGLKDEFVNRHLGRSEVVHLHHSLKPLLDRTYGVILYQEQVLRIVHEIGGFSLSEADMMRRAMSHFDPGKRMQTLQDKFVSMALELNQVPREIGERIWELMAAFAGYGFPKAHAASYAQVAWKSAWCKAHHPA